VSRSSLTTAQHVPGFFACKTFLDTSNAQRLTPGPRGIVSRVSVSESVREHPRMADGRCVWASSGGERRQSTATDSANRRFGLGDLSAPLGERQAGHEFWSSLTMRDGFVN